MITPAPLAKGVRRRWSELPESLRVEVATRLGARVLRATSVPHGFSPGAAARLALSDGRRVFAKGVMAAWNRDTFAMHQREALITRALPLGTPAPRLLLSVCRADSVALILEMVPGRPPQLPWRRNQLTQVLTAMEDLAHRLTPSPVACGRADEMAGFQDGFHRLREERQLRGDQLGDLDPWVVRHLDQLVDLEQGYGDAVRGDTLCHFDLRQDNILINRQGVTFVDWPWAVVGPPWLDLALMLPSVAMQGGPDPWVVFGSHPLAKEADKASVMAVVAAMTGYLLFRQRRPPPPGMPTVRAFQRAQAGPALRWLRLLCGWP